MTGTSGGAFGGDGPAARGGAPEILDGRYLLTRRLGHGGQGDVYLAHDSRLDREVAVKILKPETLAPEFVERFKTEAQIAARLDHENIVRVFDYSPQHLYIVMEYCEGGDLTRLIKSRRRLSLSQILGLVRQIAAALQAAQENVPPILHRDLKPGNVLFKKGVPKVADFGLAKMMGQSSGLTTTRGVVMGTIRYMSPEQSSDPAKVDQRTDIWALGVILYEMLNWARPFDRPGDEFINIAIRVRLEEPIAPRYEIPFPVMRVVRRALRKDLGERFASAGEVIQALTEAEAEVPGAADLLLPPEDVCSQADRIAAEMASLLELGNTQDAREAASQLRQAAQGDDSMIRFWLQRLHEAETSSATPSKSGPIAASWFGEVETLIRDHRFGDARRKIGEVLRHAPGDPMAQRLLASLSEQEQALHRKLDETHKRSDQARRAGDLRRLVQVWEEMADAYPDLDDVQVELAVAREELRIEERARARTAALRQCAEREAAGDLAGAVAVLGLYLGAYPGDDEAESKRDALAAQLAALQRAAQLKTLHEEASRRREQQDLTGELEAWGRVLDLTPDDSAAQERVRRLRQDIADVERRRAWEDVRTAAAAFEQSEDFFGAIAIYEKFLGVHPDDAAAREAVARLGEQVALRERADILRRVSRLVSEGEALLGAGRFGSLPQEQQRVVEVVRAGRDAPRMDDARALQALHQQLAQALAMAGNAVTLEAARQRGHLLDLIDAAHATIEGEQPGAGASPAVAVVRTAFDAAVTVLCTVQPQADGDPLPPLEQARAGLGQALEALRQEQTESLREAQDFADRGLAAAQADVARLSQALGGESGPAADSHALLEAEFHRAAEQVRSPAPTVVLAAGAALAALAERAHAARLALTLDRAAAVRRLAAEARETLLRGPDERLAELAGQAGHLLTDAAILEPEAAAGLLAVRPLLEMALGAAKDRLAGIMKTAETSWRTTLDRWRQLAAGTVDPAVKQQGDEIRQAGEAALAAQRPDDVESCAGRLTALIERAGVEAAWREHERTIRRLEGPVGRDGAPLSAPAADDAQLLARFRRALAHRAPAELREAVTEIERKLAQGRRPSPEGGAPKPLSIPGLDARTRRFNERCHPAALKRFDELGAAARSRGDKSGGGAAIPQSDLDRAREALLHAPPLWPRLAGVAATIAAAAVIVVMVTGGGPGKAQAHEVSLVSLSGTVQIERVLRDGQPFDGLKGSVGDRPQVEKLAAGHYEMTLVGGGKSVFTVPDDKVVPLVRAPRDSANPLLDALRGGQSAAPGGP